MTSKICAMNRILDDFGNVVGCRALNYRTGEYFVVAKEDWATAGFENAVVAPTGEVCIEYRGVDLNKDLEIIFTPATILYHGTPHPLIGEISTQMSGEVTDFGKGFYLGDNLEYSNQMAYGHKCTSDATIYKFEFNKGIVSTYTFTDLALWALYVGYNRGVLNIDLREYPKLQDAITRINAKDVVIGLIADDRVSNVFTEFFADRVTFGGVMEALRFVKNGYQYVFKTQESLRSLKQVGKSNLTADEAKKVKHRHDVETGHLLQQVESITKLWRRQGLYKDELLEDWR